MSKHARLIIAFAVILFITPFITGSFLAAGVTQANTPLSIEPVRAVRPGDLLQPADKLLPHTEDGSLYGYVDLSGEWVIEPQFDFADEFSEDLALVNVDEQYGYIDRAGEFVIEPQFIFATPFSEGLAAVTRDRKAGFIDQTGEMVIEPRFDFANSFQEGLALVGVDGLSGFIDSTGEYTIEPSFPFAADFSEGLAVVEVEGRYGYVDQTGKIAIEPVFDFANSFAEGLATVNVEDRMGYIDQTGELAIEPNFVVAFEFSEGLAFVDAGYEQGYIDQTGTLVIENPAISFGDTFSEGLAAVEIDGRYGYIDQAGNMVIEPRFISAGPFEDGMAFVWLDETWGYVDQTGQLLFELPIAGIGAKVQTTRLIDYLPAVPTAERAGSCFTNSVIVPLDTAWRCTVENEIFDPCLIADDGETLVCGANPILGELGFQLTLTEPLPEPEPLPEAELSGGRLSAGALQNAEYPSQWATGGAAILTEGAFSEAPAGSADSELVITLVDDLVVYGDLDGDGVEDAVVVLAANAGGTGIFYDLVAVLNADGQPNPVASVFLGDRVDINQIAIDRGEITVDLLTQGPRDGMCCPTLPLTLNYILQDGDLVSSTSAWLLELADGTACEFATGATGLVENKRINFFCSDDSVLIGGLQVGPVWHAEKIVLDEEADEPFTVEEQKEVDVLSVWQPVDPAAVTEEIGLSLAQVTFDAGILTDTLRGQVFPAVPHDPTVSPSLNGEPAHLRFVFGEEPLPKWVGIYLSSPQLLIYPVDDYLAMFEETEVADGGDRIDALQTLLADRPAEVEQPIPVLPGVGEAEQLLRAQIDYLDFNGGAGIRFVSHYAQDATPIIDDTLVYTFQGLTADGQYYISLFYPISTDALPDTVEETDAVEDYDEFLENFDTYLQETSRTLNELEPTDFAPDLGDLDAMVESLEIEK